MRRRAVGLVLAGTLLTLLLAVAASAGADTHVVAAEPLEGDRAAYEGYEAVYTPTGETLHNTSLDHQRTWTRATFPLPSGEEATVASLQHRYPVPEPPAPTDEATQATSPLPALVDLLGDAEDEETPAVSRDVVEMDAHHGYLPAAPGAFSVATLDQHEQASFWRVFRLHGIAEGWCARSPAGAFAGLPTEAARDRAEECLTQAPWGQVLQVEVSVDEQAHERWGTTKVVAADLVYRTEADGRAQARLEVRFSPQASMELERTLAVWQAPESEPVLRVRHLELTGFERGEGDLAPEQIPDQDPIEHVTWTRQGPSSPWEPALGFGEAREAVERDPRVQDYRSENPDANLTYAQFTRLNADERSSSAGAGLHPGNCENERLPATDPDRTPPEAAWSFFLSGEDEDQIALAERREASRLADETAERPPRTEATRFASPGSSPGMGLPRPGPDPAAMFEHVSVADELDAKGDPFVAVLPPGESGSTGDPAEAPLIGAAGRVHCSVEPPVTYSYENVGVAFSQGEAAGVYSLRVEAVEDHGVGVAELSSPPAGDEPGSQLSGLGLAGLALAATGAAGWAGTRLLGSLYSRLRDRELLDHEIRSSLHEAIQRSPGVCLAEIAEEVDRHRSTIAYHLDRLEEGGFVETRATDSGRVAFPAEHPLLDAAPAIAKSRARELVALVQRDPGRSLSAYADEIGVSKSYVSRLAPELEDAGLVERRRQGRRLLLEEGERAALLSG